MIMKCPFRTKIDSYKPSKDHIVTTKSFEDCYKSLCPFYIAEHYHNDWYTPARCKRADMEGKE